jgi:hypothetical protein
LTIMSVTAGPTLSAPVIIRNPVLMPFPFPPVCAPGYTWQYGCLMWAPPQKGQLFGPCIKEGYGCFRAPEPIQ